MSFFENMRKNFKLNLVVVLVLVSSLLVTVNQNRCFGDYH